MHYWEGTESGQPAVRVQCLVNAAGAGARRDTLAAPLCSAGMAGARMLSGPARKSQVCLAQGSDPYSVDASDRGGSVCVCVWRVGGMSVREGGREGASHEVAFAKSASFCSASFITRALQHPNPMSYVWLIRIVHGLGLNHLTATGKVGHV
jgi:hypothetical protein